MTDSITTSVFNTLFWIKIIYFMFVVLTLLLIYGGFKAVLTQKMRIYLKWDYILYHYLRGTRAKSGGFLRGVQKM